MKQWLLEKAQDRAWNECAMPGDVEPYAQELLKTEYTHAKEFVEVFADRVQVGINVSEIDDRAVDQAIILLSEVDEFKTGKRLEFGEPINVAAHLQT